MITDTRDPEDFEDIENHESEKDDIYNESFTERNVFKMNEQITNILEAFKAGVLSTEEATSKLNVIQEAVIEEIMQENAAENSYDEMFMTKQNHIMESYKLGIINSQEAKQLIERITMESEYMNEEDDVDDGYTDDDDTETSDSSEDISALAEYINSLDEEARAQLMGSINAPAEDVNNDDNDDISVEEDYNDTSLNEMEV